MKFALAWLAVLGARLRLRVDLEKASLARLATACLPSFTIIFEVERSPDLCDPGSINVQTVFSCNIKHRHRNTSSPSPIQEVLRAIQERWAAAEGILAGSLAETIKNYGFNDLSYFIYSELCRSLTPQVSYYVSIFALRRFLNARIYVVPELDQIDEVIDFAA